MRDMPSAPVDHPLSSNQLPVDGSQPLIDPCPFPDLRRESSENEPEIIMLPEQLSRVGLNENLGSPKANNSNNDSVFENTGTATHQVHPPIPESSLPPKPKSTTVPKIHNLRKRRHALSDSAELVEERPPPRTASITNILTQVQNVCQAESNLVAPRDFESLLANSPDIGHCAIPGFSLLEDTLGASVRTISDGDSLPGAQSTPNSALN